MLVVATEPMQGRDRDQLREEGAASVRLDSREVGVLDWGQTSVFSLGGSTLISLV